MRRHVSLALLATSILAAAPEPAKLTQPEAEAAVAAVLPALEAIRGLAFARRVPVTVIGDAKARAYALARFRRLTPEAKIRADETAYKLLGLVGRDTDVLKTLLDVLEEQAGGFYDPQTRSFYLLDDMPKAMTPLLAAHEMTHALEDQRYGIDARLEKLLDDDDAAFAFSCVAEGSASLASALYVAQALTEGQVAAGDLKSVTASDSIRTERLQAMPAVLRRQLLGPYVLGMSFLLRGSLEDLTSSFPRGDVNAAWATPPRSSEQILHPEKYWDPSLRDEPKRVVIADPTSVLGPGWTRAGAGVLGELTLGSLVGAPTPAEMLQAADGSAWTNAAAAGWGGDRFEVWTKGAEAIVLVATFWDRADDAVEFDAALGRHRRELAKRCSGARVGIVAGMPAGETRDALLGLLVRP